FLMVIRSRMDRAAAAAAEGGVSARSALTPWSCARRSRRPETAAMAAASVRQPVVWDDTSQSNNRGGWACRAGCERTANRGGILGFPRTRHASAVRAPGGGATRCRGGVRDALRDQDAPRLREAAHKCCGMLSEFSAAAGDLAASLEEMAIGAQLDKATPILEQL